MRFCLRFVVNRRFMVHNSIFKNIPGFPFTLYTEQEALYTDRESWYKGIPLNEQITDADTGETIDKYPIKINPLRSTAQKHAGLLIGQTTNSVMANEAPIIMSLTYLKEDGEKDEDRSKKVTDIISKILADSKAAALFSKNAIKSQYLGGSIFMVDYLTSSLDKLNVFAPSARNFLGIPDGEDMWNLKECWYYYEIDKDAADELGYRSPLFKSEEEFVYTEHWTRDEYEIFVNEKSVEKKDNPFGLVPAVYIPHLRVEAFVGESIVSETAKGVILEMNLRWADVGDAVSVDSHALLVGKNITGNLKQVAHANRQITMLGKSSSLSGGSKDPDLFSVATTSMSDPMMKLGDKLMEIYRRDANHPAVADGEDEGSQRSSVTITARMYPMVSEVETERALWSTGLSVLVKILLTMAEKKNLYEVNKEYFDPEIAVQWRTMMLRDRTDIANEVGVRASAGVTSKGHLNAMFGDLDDPYADAEKASEEKAAAAPQIQENLTPVDDKREETKIKKSGEK